MIALVYIELKPSRYQIMQTSVSQPHNHLERIYLTTRDRLKDGYMIDN